jgi:hypothetical protein
MTFELKKLALEEEATAQLRDPGNDMPLFAPVAAGEDPESKPVTITMRGTASAAHRRAVDAMMKKAAKRGKRDASPEEIREQSVDFLVALSVKIDNMTLDGEPVNTPEMFRKIYSDPHLDWIKDQANELVGDTEAFLKR